LYLAGLFLITYLPFVLSPRPIWMNTSLTVLPYAIMAVACFVWSLAVQFRRTQLVLSLYLLAVLVVATPLYLLACGRGMRIPVMKEYLTEKYLVQIKKTMPPDSGAGEPNKSAAPAVNHKND
jgi:phosphoglycerol transferase MdoB-like AlkP superfamily enzyme